MSDRNRRRVLAQLGLITLFSVCTSLASAQIAATWNTTSGNWTTAVLWNCTPGSGNCVPNGPSYAAILNSPGNTLTLDTTSNPSNVLVNSVDIQSGSTLVLGGATLEQHILTNEAGGTLTGNGFISTVGNTVGNIGTVTNNGAIQADAGTLNMVGTVISNFSNPGPSGTATLTGGVWQAGVTGAGVLTLPYFVGINSATLVLQNPGSQFNVNPGVGDGLSLLYSQNGGTLTLSNGASERITGPTTFSTPFLNSNSSALNVLSGSRLGIIGDLLNDSTSIVQIQNGGTLEAPGRVTNFGTFVTGNAPGDAGNNMVNSGAFTNNGGAVSLLAYGDRLSVAGDFQNINGGTVTLNTNSGMAPLANNLNVESLTNDSSSLVQVQNGSYLYVAGNANNAGQFLTGNATGDVGGSSVYVGGTFTNTGKVSVLPGGNFVYAAGDWMNLNGGAVTLNGGFSQVAGTLTNDSASTVQVQNGSTLFLNGVNNSGRFLTGNAVGDLGGNTVSLVGAGNFTNSGTLSVLGYNDQVYVGNGVVPGVGNLMNVNGGVITLNTNTGLTSGAYNLTVFGNLTNDAQSTVQVQSRSLLLVGALGAGGNVNNAGQFLTGNAPGDVGGNIVVVTGTFNNSGTLSLLASGDQLTAGTLNNDGTVTVNPGASLMDGQAFVGADAGSVGNVLIDGASWTTTGLLEIGTGGNGTVTIQDNGQLDAGSVLIGPNGMLIDDPSTVDANEDFTLDPRGILQLDVAGATSDLVSRLNISGFGSFDGIIDVDFIDGFTPTPGQSFDLINVLGGGDFSQAHIEVTGLGPGFEYGDNFSNGDFTLVADMNGTVAPEPGFWWPVAIASVVLSLAALRKNLRNRSSVRGEAG